MKTKKFRVGDVILPTTLGKNKCIAISDSMAVFCPIIYKKDGGKRVRLNLPFIIPREYIETDPYTLKEKSKEVCCFDYITVNGDYRFKLIDHISS